MVYVIFRAGVVGMPSYREDDFGPFRSVSILGTAVFTLDQLPPHQLAWFDGQGWRVHDGRSGRRRPRPSVMNAPALAIEPGELVWGQLIEREDSGAKDRDGTERPEVVLAVTRHPHHARAEGDVDHALLAPPSPCGASFHHRPTGRPCGRVQRKSLSQ